jgi:hypothetical protein
MESEEVTGVASVPAATVLAYLITCAANHDAILTCSADHDATKPVPTQYVSNVAAEHDDRLETSNAAAAAARHDDLEANMVVPAERVDDQVHATEVRLPSCFNSYFFMGDA